MSTRGLAPLSALGLLIALLCLGGRGPATASAQSIGPEAALLSVRSSAVGLQEADFVTDEPRRSTAMFPESERALLGTSRPALGQKAVAGPWDSRPAGIGGPRALLGQPAVSGR
jgi:hypothetical protein